MVTISAEDKELTKEFPCFDISYNQIYHVNDLLPVSQTQSKIKNIIDDERVTMTKNKQNTRVCYPLKDNLVNKNALLYVYV